MAARFCASHSSRCFCLTASVKADSIVAERLMFSSRAAASKRPFMLRFTGFLGGRMSSLARIAVWPCMRYAHIVCASFGWVKSTVGGSTPGRGEDLRVVRPARGLVPTRTTLHLHRNTQVYETHVP